MDLEFDKEMDALLRRAAGRGVLTGNGGEAHLDADAIAAFAENALPVKSRSIYTQHLAACDPCRMTLANLISMNAAAEPAMAAATAPVPEVSVPWYRRLFLKRNLAYVMGGLVLVFGGLFGVIVFQNSSNDGTVSVSQLAEPAAENAPARAQAANSLYSSNSTSNAATVAPGEIPRSMGVAESADQEADPTSSPAAAPPPAPPLVSGDSAPAVTAKDLSIDGADLDKLKPVQLQPAPGNAPKREDDAKEKNEAKLAAAEQQAQKPDLSQTNIFNSQQNQMLPNSATKSVGPSRNDIPRDNRPYDDKRQVEELRLKSRSVAAGTAASGERASSRSVGGKTFEMKQGAWYDTAYSGQKTTNIRRASDGYQKLDGGLRSITDSIGGTLVIVWKGKAYRIQ